MVSLEISGFYEQQLFQLATEELIQKMYSYIQLALHFCIKILGHIGQAGDSAKLLFVLLRNRGIKTLHEFWAIDKTSREGSWEKSRV